jgi:hypothetical protein
VWPIAKSFMKMGGSKAKTVMYGSLGITYDSNKKANVTVDCLANQFTSHDLCDENHE